jgi:predicted transcriptional regulator
VLRGGSKRGWYDIAVSIIDCCKNETGLEDMMQKVRQPSYRLKEYLRVLEHAGLLNCSADAKSYKVTEKGSEFLASYRHLEGLL